MLLRLFLILQILALSQLSVATGTTTPPTTRPPVTTLTCAQANEQCAFQFKDFEGKLAKFRIGIKADVPFTTRIISKTPGENLGVLNSNGIIPEFILPNGLVEPITWFGNPRFTPTHFKPFSFRRGGSGIGHQTFLGNQLDVAQGSCIRVFFSSYQVITGPKPKDVKNINAKRSDFKCVVFLTDH